MLKLFSSIGSFCDRLTATNCVFYLYMYTVQLFDTVSVLVVRVQVNFDKPDREKFPLFRDLEGFECILEPGEVLYIPMYW